MVLNLDEIGMYNITIKKNVMIMPYNKEKLSVYAVTALDERPIANQIRMKKIIEIVNRTWYLNLNSLFPFSFVREVSLPIYRSPVYPYKCTYYEQYQTQTYAI